MLTYDLSAEMYTALNRDLMYGLMTQLNEEFIVIAGDGTSWAKLHLVAHEKMGAINFNLNTTVRVAVWGLKYAKR